MSQRKAKTPAERKALERKRKRAQGLVLKQIWVPQGSSGIIENLKTQDAERPLYDIFNPDGDGGSYGNETDPKLRYAYERAAEFMSEELAVAEVLFSRDEAGELVANVIRAILKVYAPMQRAHPEMVEFVRREYE